MFKVVVVKLNNMLETVFCGFEVAAFTTKLLDILVDVLVTYQLLCVRKQPCYKQESESLYEYNHHKCLCVP